MPSKAGSRQPIWREAPDLDPTHDPGVAAVAPLAAEGTVSPIRSAAGHVLRIGTASWTDPTMTAPGVFYPPDARTPEARLRYYASRFPLVEVDASYYALPNRSMAELWVERTPDDFVFNLKAHALMTGQPTEVVRLPRELRDALPASLGTRRKVYEKDLPTEIVDAVWHWFVQAIEPLRASGKLGAVLLQYPRWVVPSHANREMISNAARRLEGIPIAVELRNHRWFSDERRAARTIGWLETEGIPFVMVDAPQGLESSVPALTVVTSPQLAMIRLHGRRAGTWEQPGVPTVERYRWFYTDPELREWIPRISEAVRRAGETHVLLNNCYGNYGAANALQLASLAAAAVGGM